MILGCGMLVSEIVALVYGKPYKDDLGRDCEVFVIKSRKPGGLVKAKKIILDRQ